MGKTGFRETSTKQGSCLHKQPGCGGQGLGVPGSPLARSCEEEEEGLAVQGSALARLCESHETKQNKTKRQMDSVLSLGTDVEQTSAPPFSSLWMCDFERTVGKSHLSFIF